MRDIALRRARRGAFSDAAAVLTAALELDPTNAECWMLLGEVHSHENRESAAIGCYRRGLAAAPGRVDLLVGLAAVLSDASRFGEAVELLSTLVEAEPENPDYLFGLAQAMHRAGRTEPALGLLDRAIAADPSAELPRFSRATMLLSLGRYGEGWLDHDARFAIDPGICRTDLPLWDGSAMPQKCLRVAPEGGYGDIIWAARFLPALRPLVGRVELALPPALRSLLSGVAGADSIHGHTETGEADLHCPILSLPGRLGMCDPEAFPPAKLTSAPPTGDRLSRLLERAGTRLRVGILWSGNEAYSDNRHRAAPLEAFLPLIERPEVQIFSLQKGPQQAVLRAAGLGDLVLETDDFDFAETAALVRSLDLVVMTDSAVAHLAGSLGARVWVLLDAAPFWLYGQRGADIPWYPSMRLFRQPAPGDWRSVMAEVETALVDLVARRQAGI